MTSSRELPKGPLAALEPSARAIVELHEERIADEFYEAIARGTEDVVVYVHHPQGTVSGLDRTTVVETTKSQWEGDLEMPMTMSEPAMTSSTYGFWILIRDDDNDVWDAFVFSWPRATGGDA